MLTLDWNPIQIVKEVKFLGVIHVFHNKLSFVLHIKMLK